MLFPKRKREGATINGSSMADIAFLLLIFFLVTTTINVDTGISMILPPPGGDPPFIHQRNMMNILVNESGDIMMDDSKVEVSEVKDILKVFIDNRRKNPELSDSPEKAIISLKTQRQTPYRVYIDMLDEVMAAYAELRDETSMAYFGVHFDELPVDGIQRRQIKDMYPKKISVAQQ
jgi:biopolymer transport protein ExbD